jgi:hypothetical protein
MVSKSPLTEKSLDDGCLVYRYPIMVLLKKPPCPENN